MKQMKCSFAIAVMALSLFLFAAVASAHVTVQPKETKQGSYEVFTVRVPSEKKEVTTKSVKVRIAEGVEFKRIEPKAGWTYELEKTADGIVKSITWTADAEGLTETEFGEFRMQGKVAADAKELVWKAYQTYSDGELVEWIGAPNTDSQYPASLTVVTAGAGEGDGHGTSGSDGHGGAASGSDASAGEPAKDAVDAANTTDTTAPADEAASANDQQSGAAADTGDQDDTMKTVTLSVSIAAFLIALAALILTIAKRRRA